MNRAVVDSQSYDFSLAAGPNDVVYPSLKELRTLTTVMFVPSHSLNRWTNTLAQLEVKPVPGQDVWLVVGGTLMPLPVNTRLN